MGEIILNCNGETTHTERRVSSKNEVSKKKETIIFLVSESDVYTDDYKAPIKSRTKTEITWGEVYNLGGHKHTAVKTNGSISRLTGDIIYRYEFWNTKAMNQKRGTKFFFSNVFEGRCVSGKKVL